MSSHQRHTTTTITTKVTNREIYKALHVNSFGSHLKKGRLLTLRYFCSNSPFERQRDLVLGRVLIGGRNDASVAQLAALTLEWDVPCSERRRASQ